MKQHMTKVLSVLLAAAMLLSLLPVTALADDPKTYEVWVGGVQVTDDNRTDVLNDGGSVVFTPATQIEAAKLTLTNAKISGDFMPDYPDATVGVYIRIPLILELVGTSSIDVAAADHCDECCGFVSIYSDLLIRGRGVLNITTGDSKAVTGFSAFWPTLRSGTITVHAGSGSRRSTAFNLLEGTMEGGTLTAVAGDSPESCGVSGPLSVTGGKITAIGQTRAFDDPPDLSDCLVTKVEVNTEPSTDGASPWENQISTLGGDRTDYKYVGIEVQKPLNPFADVGTADFCYESVLWAVYHDPQITNGTDRIHFSPIATCTRGQVVTFLWRAAGCPKPKGSNPFNDVASDAFYYKAVLWAVEKGITNGTGPDTFSPDQGCTRGQVVTFLWRAADSPEPIRTYNPFRDVTQDAYYYKAVLWAVGQGITKGTSDTKFSPDKTCTRGQIVTFLCRDDQAARKQLMLYVEDTVDFVEYGLLIRGYVENGKVRVGDEIKVWTTDSDGDPYQNRFIVLAIQIYPGNLVNSAALGDHIGLLVGKTSKTARKGEAVVSGKGEYRPVNELIDGSMTVVKDLHINDRLQFTCGGIEATAVLQDTAGGNDLVAGQSCEYVVFGDFSRRVIAYPGQKFEMYRDGTLVACFTVGEVK